MSETLAIDRPQRWDRPFGPNMTDSDVDSVLALEVFQNIDAAQFPKKQALRDIIRNDVRIRRYRRGDIVIREGDYGNSVFVIVSGTVRVVLEDVKDRALGRQAARYRRSFFEALGQLWKNARMPEVRDVATYQGGADLSIRGEASSARTFLKDVDSFIAAHNTFPMTEGEIFGEIAALSRTPRTATVFADADLELVELRWQGLRDIRKHDRAFRESIDRQYCKRRWSEDLAESPLFAHLDEKTLEIIAARTLFETHCTF